MHHQGVGRLGELVMALPASSCAGIFLQIGYESLDTKSLGLKLDFCEEMDKIVSVLEGSMSRTKGFILKSLLDTLQYMKSNNIHIDQV